MLPAVVTLPRRFLRSAFGLIRQAAANKDYEGDLQPGEAIQKLKQLNMGVYRAKGLSSNKIPNAERHYSPTSEDFYQVFGFGSDTGIAPKGRGIHRGQSCLGTRGAGAGVGEGSTMKNKIPCFGLFAFILCPSLMAAEVDDLKREFSIIQLKISEEEARYQAAKAQMERAQIVAQYLFPDLRARERQLVEKIEKLNGQK